VLVVFGVLVLLLQQRNYRRVRETFDPTFRERDTGPPPPDEPPDEQPRG
jgi:hypothetical protein